MKTLILLKKYAFKDYKTLAEIFKKSILAIDSSFYNDTQKKAWIGNRSLAFWQDRFIQSSPIVAVYEGNIVGFAEFLSTDNQGEINCFYIDPNYQNLGVGKALLNHISAMSKDNKLDLIIVNASHNAKPFFEQYGFKTVQKNVVIRDGIELENWLMELKIHDYF